MLLPLSLPPQILLILVAFGTALGLTAAGIRGVTVYETQYGLTLPRWFPHDSGPVAFGVHMVFGTLFGLVLTLSYVSVAAAIARQALQGQPTLAYILTPIFGAAVTTVVLEAFKMSDEARAVIQLHVALHAVLFILSIIGLAFL